MVVVVEMRLWSRWLWLLLEKVIGGWQGGEGGEAMLTVVGKVVRMAWFVEMRVWLWSLKCGGGAGGCGCCCAEGDWWLALWRRWLVVGVVVGPK